MRIVGAYRMTVVHGDAHDARQLRELVDAAHDGATLELDVRPLVPPLVAELDHIVRRGRLGLVRVTSSDPDTLAAWLGILRGTEADPA